MQAFRQSGVRDRSPNPIPNRCFLAVSLLTIGATTPLRAQQALRTPTPGRIIIDQNRELHYLPETGYFRSPGPVRIILIDAITGERSTLFAEDAEGTVGGDIIVRGVVRLEDVQGTISGRNLRLNMATETGSVLEARVNAPGLRVGGERVDLLPGRVLKATNATFTTCEKEERPDYKITAREIEVNVPRKKVKIRHATFYLGSTRIISLPFLERSFVRKQGTPLPLPGYSGTQGIHARYRHEFISTSSTTLEALALLSLRGIPEGVVAYERDLGRPTEDDAPPKTRIETANEPMRAALEINPPPTLRSLFDVPEEKRRATLFAALAHNSVVYNRLRGDLRVSRLPEIGAHVTNLTNRPIEELSKPGSRADLLNPSKWLMNAEASAGYYREKPTRAEAMRIGARADATSPLIPLSGSLYGRAGFTGWANAYSKGGPYVLLAPEVEANFFLSPGRMVGVGFRHTASIGSTPFVFDRRDVANAVTVRYGVESSRWAYDLGVHFDAGRGRAYDTTARVLKRTDCLEFGFGYSARDQSIRLVLNLLPAGPAGSTPPATPRIGP